MPPDSTNPSPTQEVERRRRFVIQNQGIHGWKAFQRDPGEIWNEDNIEVLPVEDHQHLLQAEEQKHREVKAAFDRVVDSHVKLREVADREKEEAQAQLQAEVEKREEAERWAKTLEDCEASDRAAIYHTRAVEAESKLSSAVKELERREAQEQQAANAASEAGDAEAWHSARGAARTCEKALQLLRDKGTEQSQSTSGVAIEGDPGLLLRQRLEHRLKVEREAQANYPRGSLGRERASIRAAAMEQFLASLDDDSVDVYLPSTQQQLEQSTTGKEDCTCGPFTEGRFHWRDCPLYGTSGKEDC